jgi:altronate dehydratase
MDLSKATFWGFKRENGRIGVRNHVIILPVDDLSNAAAEAVIGVRDAYREGCVNRYDVEIKAVQKSHHRCRSL